MKQAYDASADALYITLRELAEGEHVARTVEIDASTMVDEDAGGRIIGIEVLSPDRSWPVWDIMRRWDISDGDLAMILRGYPCAPAFSMSVTW